MVWYRLVLNNVHYLVGVEVLTAVDMTPCSPLKVNRRFGGTRRLHLEGLRTSRARNQREHRWQSLEAICSSETSVDFQRTTRCHIIAIVLFVTKGTTESTNMPSLWGEWRVGLVDITFL
jgi:hypothetical protein